MTGVRITSARQVGGAVDLAVAVHPLLARNARRAAGAVIGRAEAGGIDEALLRNIHEVAERHAGRNTHRAVQQNLALAESDGMKAHVADDHCGQTVDLARLGRKDIYAELAEPHVVVVGDRVLPGYDAVRIGPAARDIDAVDADDCMILDIDAGVVSDELENHEVWIGHVSRDRDSMVVVETANHISRAGARIGAVRDIETVDAEWQRVDHAARMLKRQARRGRGAGVAVIAGGRRRCRRDVVGGLRLCGGFRRKAKKRGDSEEAGEKCTHDKCFLFTAGKVA